MLASMYTSHLPFRTNAVKPPLVFTCMSPLFNFNFLVQSQGVSFLFGHTILHEFICLVSKSSESLGNKKNVHKQFVSYTFNSARLMS
jgi:hypothetical protein